MVFLYLKNLDWGGFNTKTFEKLKTNLNFYNF